MYIKNAAFEINRHNPQAIVVSLHLGTLNGNLSHPFQSKMPANKLFSPRYATAQFWNVLTPIWHLHKAADVLHGMVKKSNHKLTAE